VLEYAKEERKSRSGIDRSGKEREMLDVKEAVTVAFQYVEDLFSQDGIVNLGLEEVEYDPHEDAWAVTVGFSRPWDLPARNGALIPVNPPTPRRDYKVVRVDANTGRVESVKNRAVN
jgi:hypothetical protein